MAAGGHPIPARAHLTRLVLAHHLAGLQARVAWQRQAEAEVARWSSTELEHPDGVAAWYGEAAEELRATLQSFAAR